MSGIAEGRHIWLPDPDMKRFPANAWVGKYFLPEVGAFPVSEHDDQVDSMSQGVNQIRKSQAYGATEKDDDGTVKRQDEDSHGRGASLGMGPQRFRNDGGGYGDDGGGGGGRGSLFGRGGGFG